MMETSRIVLERRAGVGGAVERARPAGQPPLQGAGGADRGRLLLLHPHFLCPVKRGSFEKRFKSWNANFEKYFNIPSYYGNVVLAMAINVQGFMITQSVGFSDARFELSVWACGQNSLQLPFSPGMHYIAQ